MVAVSVVRRDKRLAIIIHTESTRFVIRVYNIILGTALQDRKKTYQLTDRSLIHMISEKAYGSISSGGPTEEGDRLFEFADVSTVLELFLELDDENSGDPVEADAVSC